MTKSGESIPIRVSLGTGDSFQTAQMLVTVELELLKTQSLAQRLNGTSVIFEFGTSSAKVSYESGTSAHTETRI